MNDGSTRTGGRLGVRRELGLLFGVTGFVLVIIAVGAVFASTSVAKAQALKEAEGMTQRMGDLALGPLLTKWEHDPTQFEVLDSAVRDRMSDGYLTEITVWRENGGILYSDDPSEIGTIHDPPAEVVAAIQHLKTTSGVELHPEVVTKSADPKKTKFVEVYVPLVRAGEPTVAFEAYYDYGRVLDTANALRVRLIPLVLVPLLLLQLVQIPVAFSLARRIRRHEADRATLLKRALSMSEKERIRIAGDLHDGPIQDIAGVGYALGAIATVVPEQQKALMDNIQSTTHHAVESLRRLMVDLYPPDLDAAQLPQTIANLAVPLRDRDIDVEVKVEALPELHNDIVTTLYRVARESLANVAQHAQAKNVRISLGLENNNGSDASRRINLKIIDDGVGLDPARVNRRAEGHLGLRLLQDRVESLGGTLTLEPRQGGGTEVTAQLPLEPAD